MKEKIWDAAPLHDMEEVTYHAFREWPVLLILRQKELEAHLRNEGVALPTPPANTEPQPEGEE